MTNDITITKTSVATHQQQYDAIAAMVLDTVSERSQRDYKRALVDFMQWYADTRQPILNRAAVNAHIAHLKAEGVTDSSINQRLAAIRKLALEAADNGLLDESAAQSIKRIKNIKIQGKKLCNWLTKEQAERMLNAPDTDTLIGLRNRAILALMIGCGLRREEVATLTIEHIQQREGRWAIVDLTGKHNRTRTVPMASWVKHIIDNWSGAAGITEGVLFRRIRRGDHLQEGGMTSQAIWNVVQKYSPVEGLAPHDLRRTFAKLAHTAGAPIEQIQQSLGHASIQTTENYLGVELDFQNAPSDYICLDLGG